MRTSAFSLCALGQLSPDFDIAAAHARGTMLAQSVVVSVGEDGHPIIWQGVAVASEDAGERRMGAALPDPFPANARKDGRRMCV